MDYKGNIPVFELSGNSYEIGYGVGAQAKKYVLNCVQSYKDMFWAFNGLDWEKCKKLAQQYIPTIESYDPDYIEEMKGIADGAGLTFDDILLLNCRSEVVLRGNADLPPDGCTAIAVTPERTGGSTYIGQNWDWKPSQRDSMIIVKINQTANDKPNLVLLTEAGIIGKYGMNSYGLGFCFNAMSVNEFPHGGLPLHIALRGAMDSQNLCEAALKVTKMQLGCSVNFMIASADGEAIDIEISNDDFDILYPEKSIIVHANNFKSLRLPRHPYRETSKAKWPDTFIRTGRAEKLMRAIEGDIKPQDFMKVFSDHADFPTSICHHEDPRDPVHNRLGTVTSFIMDLNRMEMYVALGSPCMARYQLYKF